MARTWYNPIIAALLRSPLHAVLSGQVMLVTYTGRKSGQRYTMPVNYVQDEDVLWTVSLRERTWWRNARGGMAVSLRLRGRDVAATATAVESEAGVARALAHICALNPRYARALGIAPAATRTPETGSLRQAAQPHVVVRTVVQQPIQPAS